MWHHSRGSNGRLEISVGQEIWEFGVFYWVIKIHVEELHDASKRHLGFTARKFFGGQ